MALLLLRRALPQLPRRPQAASRRTLTTAPPPPSHQQRFATRPPPPANYKSPFTTATPAADELAERQRETRRACGLAMGALAGMMALYVAAKMGAPDMAESSGGGGGAGAAKGLRVLHEEGEVATGIARVSTLPAALRVPPEALGEEEDAGEYVLLGWGVRTVSFLRVQVYVAGLYIHRGDLPLLHRRLLAGPAPPTSAAAALMGPPVRTLLRIVPVRNTDWAHLRDGFVRAVLAHALPDDHDHEDFSAALAAFKALFRPAAQQLPRAVPAGAPLLLVRGRRGGIALLYAGAGPADAAARLGALPATAIARALWEGYLGAGSVASEDLRAGVCEGLLRVRAAGVGGWRGGRGWRVREGGGGGEAARAQGAGK
ncbi:chalcone-flavanone isomerase-domain-containing protein [Tirmania nivea]|nr:chalcone-flavanone isomerase-domain-containing protein [Tirmania nivea]